MSLLYHEYLAGFPVFALWRIFRGADQEELARRLRFGRRIVDDGEKEADGGDRQP